MKMTATEVDVSPCFHCGEDIKDESIQFDNHAFCCKGCKTVYELLSDNDMCNYYDLDDKSRISPKEINSDKFNFLDSEKIAEKLLDFKDNEIAIITLHLPQIHCSSCIWLLENLHKLHPSIVNSRVQFMKRELKVTFRLEDFGLKQLAVFLSSLGYEPNISLESGEKKGVTSSNSYLFKIGIAGFAFGNIMLISLPDYLGMSQEFYSQYAGFFNVLNILLSIPVFFYCASDYFKSAWVAIKSRFISIDIPIAFGIFVLFARSLYEVLAGIGPGFFDSLAGLVFFLLLGKYFQQKTYDNLSFDRDYKSYFPISVSRLKKGEEETIPLNEIKVGDRLYIRNEEIIPADCILIKGKANINNSFVTGESRSISKKEGEKIFAGAKQMGEAIEVEVIKEVSQSYLTQLWNESVFTKPNDRKFEGLSNQLSKYFTIAVLLISTITGVYWMINDASIALNAVTAVLIITCPCASALSAPFTLGNMMRIFSKYQFYLKNTLVIEDISKIDTVVFDKTGTITRADESEIYFEGINLNTSQKTWIKSAVNQSNHPLSKQLSKYFKNELILKTNHFEELPGKGIVANFENTLVLIGSSKFIGLENDEYKSLQTSVFIKINDEYIGRFVFKNKFRDNLSPIISKLSQSKTVYLLSGDNESEKENLIKMGFDESRLIFNQNPDDKLNFIKQLQKDNHSIMMVGDGLNDAGALKQSNVGVAMAESANAFSPACDAILESKKFDYFSHIFDLSEKSIRIIYLNLAISVLYNCVGLYFAVQGLLSPVYCAILMPLSSITVVSVATLLTNTLEKKLK